MSWVDTAFCAERSFIIRPLVNCIPAWIRFAQCLRRYRDTKEAFPHLVNAGKYSSTFFVVIFATLKNYYKGKWLELCRFFIKWTLEILQEITSKNQAKIRLFISGLVLQLWVLATPTRGTLKWIGDSSINLPAKISS